MGLLAANVTIHNSLCDSGLWTVSWHVSSFISISGFSGTIRTNATVQYNPSQPTVHLVVTARDHGNPVLSAVVAVRVQVTDVNNHAPTFLQSKYR